MPEISIYAPTARAEGRWRAGPEIGGAGAEGSWEELGTGGGYGLHVVQKSSLNSSIRRWQRFTALSGNGDYTPIIHAFETPKGKHQSTLVLLNKGGDPIRFENIELTPNKAESAWQINAVNEGATLSGTLITDKDIETFKLQDHLNALEQIVAGSLADITRHRFSADYDMTLTMNGTEKHFTGKTLAEDILLGKEKKKKRRSRR